MPPSIRHAPSLRYEPSGIDMPAAVCCIQDVIGRGIAIQRIYLTPDGQAKAGVAKPKLALGSIKG